MHPRLLPACLLICLAGAAHAQPLSTAFTFQGDLRSAGTPAAGVYDVRFRLYDAQAAGAQVGPTLCSDNVAVSAGLFTASLDFGAQFAGAQRFLEVEFRQDTGLGCADATGFVVLTPRQPLSAAPNAAFALTAATATNSTTAANALQLNSQPPDFYRNAANLNGGSLADARLAGAYSGPLSFTNAANTFTGSGAGLTALSAANIGSGSLSDARLSPNVALLNAPQTFTGSHTFSGGLSTNQFALTTGAAPGMVLTSDGSGVGTWQSGAALALPYSGSANAANPTAAFKATNTGTGYGIWGEGVDGVRGLSSAVGGNGVYGQANNGIGAVGVYGFSTAGIGTFGGSDTGYGVYGYCQTGPGVFGNSFNGYGVHGRSESTDGVHGVTTVASGNGVYGESNTGSLAYGVYGTSNSGYGVVGDAFSTTGRGVWGKALASTGATYGGFFQADSTAATGVYGYSSATSGFTFGGLFQSNSPDGRAVRATNTATTGQGVGGRFGSSSNAGLAIWCTASAATGTTYGGFFESTSTGGFGVYGQASATTGVTYGGRFISSSNAGIGVSGVATAGAGAIYGVHGLANGAASYGVYSQGNLGCSGNKQFRIDHPADPENKYLIHYCHEGPEPQNVYNGKVTLDSQGEATIDLPPYFASINKDPRYTLTPIGAAMPLLHIAEEVSDDALTQGANIGPGQPIPAASFRIAGGAPNAKVSWEVKALRNDRWNQHNGAPVEVEKQAPEKSTYQHPDLYNQPPEKATGYVPNRAEVAPATDQRPSNL